MPAWLSIILILLGIVLLFLGKRLWLVGAGVGALLGVSLVGLVPALQGIWLGALVILGLAVALGVLAVVFKGFSSLIAFGLGFLAGSAIILGILDLFSINGGIINIALALIAGLVGAGLARRFFKWVIMGIAALTGALLVVRGFGFLIGGNGLNEFLASLLVLVIAGGGFWYQYQQEKKS
jgi:hypothetical protein